LTFDTEPSIEETPPSGGRELVVAYLPQHWVMTIGVFNFAVLSRLLEPAGMGAYATCTVFVLLLTQLFLMGTEFGTQYFMMDKKITVDEAVTLNLIYSTLAALLAVTSGILLIRLDLGVLRILFEQAPNDSLYLSTTMILPLAINHSFTIQLSGLRRYGILARAQLFRTIAQTAVVLGLVWIFDMGINGGILSLTVSHIVLLVLLSRDLRREYGISLRMPRRHWFVRTVGYGVRANPLHIGMGLERRMGITGLNVTSEGAEVGFFSTAISHISRFVEIPQVVGVVIYPRLFGNEEEEERSADVVAFSLWLRLMGVFMVAVAVLLIAFSWPLVRVLHGPKYMEVIPLLWILAPGLVAMALAAVLAPYFNSLEKPGVTSWSMGMGVLVNLVGLLILLPVIGTHGAAVALTAGVSCRALVLVVAFHRTSGLSVLKVWLLRKQDFAYLMAIIRDVRGMARRSTKP